MIHYSKSKKYRFSILKICVFYRFIYIFRFLEHLRGDFVHIEHHTHRLPDYFTHVHNEYEIMYCIEGSYDFHFGSEVKGGVIQEVRIKPKTLLLLPNGIPHGTGWVQYPYDRYFLQLSSTTMERLSAQTTFQPACFAHESGTEGVGEPQVRIWDVSESAEKLESLLAQMYALRFIPDIDEAWQELNFVSLLGLFWCEVYRNHPNFFVSSRSQYTKPIREVKDYIDRHYEQALTIETLSDICYLSPSYLSKAFRSQVGMSPRQYLTKKRLQEARRLICSTQIPIQDVAMMTGFSDVNCFIQQFKSGYGDTPKQYRRSNNEEKLIDGGIFQ